VTASLALPEMLSDRFGTLEAVAGSLLNLSCYVSTFDPLTQPTEVNTWGAQCHAYSVPQNVKNCAGDEEAELALPVSVTLLRMGFAGLSCLFFELLEKLRMVRQPGEAAVLNH
jgi:hypothetical protein